MEQEDSESPTTSMDEENTENFCEHPTRDTIAEGLLGLFKPAVDQLDERVRATRLSQLELKTELDNLLVELKKIQDIQQVPVELDSYVKKLINVKHKVTVVSNVLQSATDRLNRLHQLVDREKLKKRALLDSELSTSASHLTLDQSVSRTDSNTVASGSVEL